MTNHQAEKALPKRRTHSVEQHSSHQRDQILAHRLCDQHATKGCEARREPTARAAAAKLIGKAAKP
jgi:hypothetical protein